MGTLFRNPGNDDLSLQLYINTYNTIFLFVAISVAYGMVGVDVQTQPCLDVLHRRSRFEACGTWLYHACMASHASNDHAYMGAHSE